MSDPIKNNAEKERLAVSSKSAANKSDVEGVPWKKWGPYLSERQWGTVREDYSANGDAWNYSAFSSAIAMAVARSIWGKRKIPNRSLLEGLGAVLRILPRGDNGAGIGASHQTGWTGCIARTIQIMGDITKELVTSVDAEMAVVKKTVGK
jgi:hypothetical protein